MTRDRLMERSRQELNDYLAMRERVRRQGLSFGRLLKRLQRPRGHLLNGGRIGEKWRTPYDEIFSRIRYVCRKQGIDERQKPKREGL